MVWKKVSKNKWKKGNKIVDIYKGKYMDSWRVDMTTDYGSMAGNNYKTFKTKPQALKFANTFMKKNKR